MYVGPIIVYVGVRGSYPGTLTNDFKIHRSPGVENLLRHIALVRTGRVRVIPRARSVVSRVRRGMRTVATSESTHCGCRLRCISTTTPFPIPEQSRTGYRSGWLSVDPTRGEGTRYGVKWVGTRFPYWDSPTSGTGVGTEWSGFRMGESSLPVPELPTT